MVFVLVGLLPRDGRRMSVLVDMVGGMRRIGFRDVPGMGILVVAAALLAVVVFVGISRLAGPFRVQAEFYRVGEGVEERLLAGGRLTTGDRLFLEIEGSESLHVYVLNEDEQGAVFVLFPLPALDQQNPLPSRVRHRLPGTLDGVANYWDLTSSGGRETLLVIASRGPLPEVHSELERLPRAGDAVQPEETDSQLPSKLRGIGGLSELPRPEDVDAALDDLTGKMAIRAANRRDVWIWEVRLNNPQR